MVGPHDRSLKPKRDPLDRFALVLAAGALVVLTIVILSTISAANTPTIEATPSPPPTLRPADLTGTHVAAATANANDHLLALTLAAVMQVTPGRAVLGINPIGTVPGPADSPDFVAQDVWVGLVNGSWYSLYAGALRSSPQQGALLLVTVSGSSISQEQFTAPLSNGPLHISDATVERLTLVSPSGAQYFFDVLARRFVGSLIAYADTATPLPSLTPSMTPTPSATITATVGTVSPSPTPTS